MPVSVVVCSHDRAGKVRVVLESLAAQNHSVEIIVVDSCSPGDGVRAVGEASGVPTFRSDILGLPCAKNVGLAQVQTEFVAFPSDNCIVSPGWAGRLVAGFTGPDVGFVAGPVLPDPPTKDALSASYRLRDADFPSNWADPFGCGNGANMCFRTDALRGIGGFDECLGSGAPFFAGEDSDVVLRLLRAGWSGRYVADALVSQPQWRAGWSAARRRYEYGIAGGVIAAKAIRLKDQRGRALAASRLWGVYGLGSARRQQDWNGQSVAAGLCQATGAVAGLVRGWRAELDGDKFRRPEADARGASERD